MIAVSSRDKNQAVADSIRQAGGEVININTNADGVKIEK